MLTYDDCVGLCGLTAEEIDAIARQEHLPGIVALEMGACLSRMPVMSSHTVAAAAAISRKTAAHPDGAANAFSRIIVCSLMSM